LGLWNLARRQTLKLAIFMRRFQLDGELAAGVDPP
jgi:hypothetical protein